MIVCQKEILDSNQQIKNCLQRHEVTIERLSRLFEHLTNITHSTLFETRAKSVCVFSLGKTSTTNQATKQLRSKQIPQLFGSTSYYGSPKQDVIDCSEKFNRKCDDIQLDDSQRSAIARGLMTKNALL